MIFKKLLLYFLSFLLFLGVLAFCNRAYIAQHIEAYVSKNTQETFGNLSLEPNQEQIIKKIAHEMGIDIPFFIRKMNYKALSIFGYHNAFTYFPLLFAFIPVATTPYLFISEGFFEDLSQEEQRFLIGHELIHINEKHTQYLNGVTLCLFLALLTLCYFLRRFLKAFLIKYSSKSFQRPLIIFITCILLVLCIIIPDGIALVYRRHIERVADQKSMETLNTYDGCLKFIDRCQREFRANLHNNYFGLFSDHPSWFERKQYCLELKNKYRKKNETNSNC